MYVGWYRRWSGLYLETLHFEWRIFSSKSGSFYRSTDLDDIFLNVEICQIDPKWRVKVDGKYLEDTIFTAEISRAVQDRSVVRY